MKQTAVEWLISILKGQKESPFDYNEWLIALQHAEYIEKEQIIDAYDKGEFNQGCNDEAEQYYNETYKK